MNHAVKLSNIGKVKYKIIVTIWAMTIDLDNPIAWIMIGVILTNKITANGWATTFNPICVLLKPLDSSINDSKGIRVPSFMPIIRAHKNKTIYVL